MNHSIRNDLAHRWSRIVKKRWLWPAYALAIALIAIIIFHKQVLNSLIAENHNITHGEFRGLRIGSGQDDVLNAIRNLNNSALITAIPIDNYQLSSSDLSDLKRITSSPGFRLMNYQGFAINVLFSGNRVSSVYYSVPAQATKYFELNESEDQVIRELGPILTKHDDYFVIPIMDSRGKVGFPVAQLDAESKKMLFSYKAWRFNIETDKPLGANVDLYFDGGRLSRIHYLRPRTQVE